MQPTDTLPSDTLPYRCPGQTYAISESVHLGRLASFYPACRTCPHAGDTGSLSKAQVLQLEVLQRRVPGASLFHDEGVGGIYLNELYVETVRRLATAFGVCLRRTRQGIAEDPTVVIARDGRPLTSELLAAGSEGLRFAGCKVVDIGDATAPCLVFAIDHLPAAGGLMIGNPRGLPQHVGLKFWGEPAEPFSRGGKLDAIEAIVNGGIDRPVRRYGSLRRFRAEVPYLACLHKYFHALRPLRVVLDTASGPLTRYVRQLAESVACEIITPGRLPTAVCDRATCLDSLAARVRQSAAHFGMWIDGDGESCHVIDQSGQQVKPLRLSALLLKYLLDEHPDAEFVVEDDGGQPLIEMLDAAGARVHRSPALRESMAGRLRSTAALAGGGTSGRIWFNDHQPAADALKTLSLLLNVLSQSDRDLSDVLAATGWVCEP